MPFEPIPRKHSVRLLAPRRCSSTLRKAVANTRFQMPPHEVGEGRLLALARETVQQFKILAPIAHL